MFHPAERPVGIGLDAELERFIHSLESDLDFAVAHARLGAVAAVAALLRADVGLCHILDRAFHCADRELVFHVAVALACPACIFHCVKNVLEAECFAESGDDLIALYAVQCAGHQNAVFRALIAVGHCVSARLVGQFCLDAVSVQDRAAGDHCLYLLHERLHHIVELQIRVVVGRRSVKQRIFGIASHDLSVGKGKRKVAAREAACIRQRQITLYSRHILADHDLLLRDDPAGLFVLSRDDHGQISVHRFGLGNRDDGLFKRLSVRVDHIDSSVVPCKGQLIAVAGGKRCRIEKFKTAA